MSRTGPMGQLGMKLPLRRPASEDPSTTQPITQPGPRWPPPQFSEPAAPHPQQHGYGQQQGHGQQQGYGQQPGHGQQQPAPGYFFPQSAREADAGHGYAPQAPAPVHQLPFSRLPPAPDAGHDYAPQGAAQPLPFSRFPQPAAEPDPNYGYPQQGAEPPFNSYAAAPPQQQPGPSAPPWSQQSDPRSFDLGNYMSAPGQQGYAQQPDPAHFQQPQDAGLFGAPQQGYAETDGEFEEPLGEEEEPPARGRRGLMIVAALVGAIGLGGGMAYTYKAFFAGRSGPAPVIKDTQGPIKSKPEVADGRGFPHTDKKLLNRLGEDANQPAPPATPASAEAPDDRSGDDPNAPRKVRIIPISPGGGQAPVTTAAASPPVIPPPMVTVPGVTLENLGPRPMQPRAPMPPQAAPQQPPSAARIELPPQAGPPPARAVQPPVRVASAANTPAPPAVAVASAPVAKKAPAVAPASAVVKEGPAKSPVPKTTKQAAMTTGASPGGASGYVAVLSSQKTRMDALKVFADMQQKYGDVLASKTPDVQEANLGDKGVWYRAVVGPPGSRDAASGLCSQLKTAGYAGCWVTAY